MSFTQFIEHTYLTADAINKQEIF